jgi:chromosome segregation protein
MVKQRVLSVSSMKSDAPLDDANVTRFLKLLGKFAESTSLSLSTTTRNTMEAAISFYGVTMNKRGFHTIVSV